MRINEIEDNTDENAGWYIVNVNNDKIGAGPYLTRSAAVAETKYFQWYKVNEYDFVYGTIDEWGGFVELPTPQQ